MGQLGLSGAAAPHVAHQGASDAPALLRPHPPRRGGHRPPGAVHRRTAAPAETGHGLPSSPRRLRRGQRRKARTVADFARAPGQDRRRLRARLRSEPPLRVGLAPDGLRDRRHPDLERRGKKKRPPLRRREGRRRRPQLRQGPKAQRPRRHRATPPGVPALGRRAPLSLPRRRTRPHRRQAREPRTLPRRPRRSNSLRRRTTP
mmetsp:Transcript_21867/g.70398  ORF Transcript_21867/g.70398 Transcript_21867/m.70398 type:complete len:203 (-) Transcript_21867:1085-1693(-)